MTEQLAQNLAYLKRAQPYTYEAVIIAANDRANSSYKLVSNSNQSYNIQSKALGDALLYSKYDPSYESNRWCESQQLNKAEDEDIILFGLGLTYHLSALIERYPKRKVFIYEPEVELFLEMLNIVDISLLYEHANVKYIGVGTDELSLQRYFEAINKYCTLEYEYVRIPFYEKFSLDIERVFLHNLKQISLRKKAVVGLNQTFGKIMFTNSLRNIPVMLKTPTLQTLKNQYVGATALIIGGGPSLQYDIEHIKKMQDEWLIIAAGSSVQSLSHYGIKPHLIVSMDAGEYNANIFRANSFIDIPLLMMPQIHHEIVTLHHDNNMYAYYNNDVIVNFLIPYQDQNYIMIPTYSVTGTAIQAAVYMGATTVILTGQDLSYPGKQRYAPGAAHLGNNTLNYEDKELQYEVENVKGTTNPTTFSMLQTLKDIEQLLVKMNTITFINSSQEGAVIAGAAYQNMKEISNGSARKKYLYANMKTTLVEKPMYHSLDAQLLNEKLQSAVTYVTVLLDRVKRLERELGKLNEFSRTKPNKAAKLLQNLEKQLNELFGEDTFTGLIKEWFIIDYTTVERQLLDVAKEPQLIKRIKLLIEILLPFLNKMVTELPGIKKELTYTMDRIQIGK